MKHLFKTLFETFMQIEKPETGDVIVGESVHKVAYPSIYRGHPSGYDLLITGVKEVDGEYVFTGVTRWCDWKKDWPQERVSNNHNV